MKTNGFRSVAAGRRYILAILILSVFPSCEDDNDEQNVPAFGTVSIAVNTSGAEPDNDGYRITMNDLVIHADPNDLLIFEEMPAGFYTIHIDGARNTCDLFTPDRTIRVTGGKTTEVRFDFLCTSKPIVYSNGMSGVFRMNLDGSNKVMVHYGGEPVWSPDGQKIALWVEEKNDEWAVEAGVYTVNEDGTGSHLMHKDARRPAWSPDGEFLVTVYNDQLYRVSPDGSEYTQITSLDGMVDFPDWGSGTSGIIFSYQPASAEGGIFRINPDGSGLEQLTSGMDSQPAWSRDGSRIAFTRDYGDHSSVFILQMDNLDLYERTLPGQSENSPRWSPDNSQIMFISEYDSQCHGPMESWDCVLRQIALSPVNEPALIPVGAPQDSPLRVDWRAGN